MENYKSGINDINYNFGESGHKYIENTFAKKLYNNIAKYASRGSHIGDYKK